MQQNKPQHIYYYSQGYNDGDNQNPPTPIPFYVYPTHVAASPMPEKSHNECQPMNIPQFHPFQYQQQQQSQSQGQNYGNNNAFPSYYYPYNYHQQVQPIQQQPNEFNMSATTPVIGNPSIIQDNERRSIPVRPPPIESTIKMSRKARPINPSIINHEVDDSDSDTVFTNEEEELVLEPKPPQRQQQQQQPQNPITKVSSPVKRSSPWPSVLDQIFSLYSTEVFMKLLSSRSGVGSIFKGKSIIYNVIKRVVIVMAAKYFFTKFFINKRSKFKPSSTIIEVSENDQDAAAVFNGGGGGGVVV